MWSDAPLRDDVLYFWIRVRFPLRWIGKVRCLHARGEIGSSLAGQGPRELV